MPAKRKLEYKKSKKYLDKEYIKNKRRNIEPSSKKHRFKKNKQKEMDQEDYPSEDKEI